MEINFQKRYDAAQDALAELTRELNILKQRIAILEAEKIQWEQQKLLQETIIQQALTSANATNNNYLEENSRLKEEIRRLKDRKD